MRYSFFILMIQSSLNLFSCNEPNIDNAPKSMVDSVSVTTEGIYTIKRSFKNGKIRDFESFANNKRNGWYLSYFPNGNVQLEQRYLQDKLIGSSTSFYLDGRPETYNCFDFEGNNRRVKMYDTKGKVVKDEGALVAQVQVYADSVFRIPANSKIIIDAVIATPPNEKVNVDMYLNGKLIKSNVHLNDNIATLDTIISNRGEYKLLTKATSLDSITQKRYIDSIGTKFEIW